MSVLIKIFIPLIIIFGINNSYGQSLEDFAFAKGLTSPHTKSSVFTTFKDHITNNKNEVDMFFSGLFFVYKEFFSSQDANKCAFYPSCSLYGNLAVKKQGLIKGGIMTLDRLTRCNGLSPEKYKIDLKDKKLIDPVKW